MSRKSQAIPIVVKASYPRYSSEEKCILTVGSQIIPTEKKGSYPRYIQLWLERCLDCWKVGLYLKL